MKKFIIAAILSLSMLTAYSDTDTSEAPETQITAENVDHIIIQGVEYSTSLTELDLSEKRLTDEDIKDLDKMTNLTELYLYGNQINDISPLAGLTNLTTLDLKLNQISDISPLNDLTNLTDLRLSFNNISDISPLKDMTDLTELYLWKNQISDISS